MQFKTTAFASSNRAAHRLHLLAGACLSLCSAVAQAAAPTQAELASIVLYGNTTIAQDTTSAWGIWDTLEPTAAGPSLPRTDRVTPGEVYRPLAQWTLSGNTSQPVAPQAESICSGGGICGFGVFYNGYDYGGYMYTPVNETPVVEQGAEAPTVSSNHPYALTAKTVAAPVQETVMPGPFMPFPMPFPILLQPAAVSSEIYPAALEVLSTPMVDGSLLLPGAQTLVSQGKGYYSMLNQFKGDGRYSLEVSRWDNDYFKPEDVQATWYQGDIYQYIAGSDSDERERVRQGVFGVAGVTTSDADMANLRASNATATYVGFDGKGQTYKANVKLDVNFGNGSFTGTFNGGTDGGYVAKANTPNGTQLHGQVGFTVTSGVITGANFKSTGLSAADGTVKGSVTGAFFGSMAAAAGGVADITKTRNDGAYTDARFTTPFLVIKGLDANTVRPGRD